MRTRKKRVVVRCYYNAGGGGHATKIRFSPSQQWVGNDLIEWGWIRLTPMDRALRVMVHYERTRNTNHWAYRKAQLIARSILTGGKIDFRKQGSES